jgi:hypothetical protein
MQTAQNPGHEALERIASLVPAECILAASISPAKIAQRGFRPFFANVRQETSIADRRMIDPGNRTPDGRSLNARASTTAR